MRNSWIVLAVLALGFSINGLAQGLSQSAPEHEIQATSPQLENVLDELDPFDPNIEETLNKFDEVYESETGQESDISDKFNFGSDIFLNQQQTCVRNQCEVWAQVVRSTQTLYLYVRGNVVATWKVSTGVPGRGTPNFDRHPNGRIYDRYTSSKFPGGDYQNLGNMPYAVFIEGGFAIHGTGTSNWPKLGKKASHGCIRIHPDNGRYFNRLVRQAGIKNVWITVQE
jgi:hypothetical protein